MKIVAIGYSPFDVENGCSGTLSKFIDRGYEVYLIITAKTSMMTKKKMTANHLRKKIGASEIYFAGGFDHSVVTQKNVNILRKFIEPLNPVIAVIPSPLTAVESGKVLGRSSLLACRGIGNILMYYNSINLKLSPSIYSIVDENSGLEVFDTNRILLLNNDVF